MPISRLIYFLCICFLSTESYAKFSKQKPIHTIFNAHLLKPKEVQISIFSMFRIGITQNLEVGLNPMLFGNMPNIAFKYNLFEAPNFKTSYSNFSAFKSEKNIPNTKSNSNSNSFVVFHGITTNFNFNLSSTINFGLFDLYTSNTTKESIGDNNSSIHIPMLSSGIDYILNPSWGLTSQFMIPIGLYGNQTSGNGESSVGVGFVSLNENNFLYNITTFTYSAQSFNLEFGALYYQNLLIPYANIFWRFDI